MNHQEMIDDISDDIRNVSIPTKITRWINLATVYLASKYIFGHLNEYGSVNTAVGDPDVTLADNFLWPKNVQAPSLNKVLEPCDENIRANLDANYRTEQGTPQEYYLNGLKLGLIMVPSTVIPITYQYQRRPVQMPGTNLTTETPELPEEWHQLICQRAKTSGYRYEKNMEQVAESLAAEKKLLFELGILVNKRPDVNVVFGSERGVSKLARPRLPSNFPSPRY